MDEQRPLPSLYDRNAEFICRASVASLTSAFIRAAEGETSPEFPMFAEPSVPSQLFILYDAVPLDAKEKMKEALLGALMEWKPAWHGYGALRNLVLTAGYVRATGVVDVLRRLLAESDIKPNNPKAREALEISFGVLAGFAPLPAVRTALERAQNDERYQKYFAAQIMNGLCWCDPERFPEYLHKFMTVAEGSRHYRVGNVVAEMVRLIGAEVVTRRTGELNDRATEIVMEVLSHDHKPIIKDGDIYIDVNGEAVPLQERGDLIAVIALARAAVARMRHKFGRFNEYGQHHAARLR
jgi:hypothetical protein